MLVAHVQEPGANDNGSGSGTLQAIAERSRRHRARARHGTAGTHAHVHVARRSARQPAVAVQGVSGAGEGDAVHVLTRHDGRGQWRKPVAPFSSKSRPIRRPSGPGRPIRTPSGAPATVPAESVKGSLLNDRLPCGMSAPGEGHSMGGAGRTPTKAEAITPRSPTPEFHPAGLALHRSLLPHEPRSPGQDSPVEMTNVGDRRSRPRPGSSRRRTARCGSGCRPPRHRPTRGWRWRRNRVTRSSPRRRIARTRKRLKPTVAAAWRKWYDEALDSVNG